jgi:ribose/xylose/arabinose/galactoside ABC-type transport system permease subunit
MTTAPTAAPRARTLALPGGREGILLVIIVLVTAAVSLFRPLFLDMENIGNILLESAQVTLLGLGMMAVIIAGGIDVSIGAGITFAASFVGKALLAGWSWPAVLLLAVAVGLAIGCVNGFLIGVSRVHPIIITLGTMNIFRTMTLYVLGGQWLFDMPDTLRVLGSWRPLHIPLAFWIVAVMGVLMHIYMTRYPGGRAVYAIGSNVEAAKLAGIRVAKTSFLLYAFLGVLVGLGAMVYIGRTGVVQNNSLTGFEMSVISAVILGGTSALGGRGTVLGTFLGAFLIALIKSAMVFGGVPALYEGIVLWLLIIFAVMADTVGKRRKEAQ